MHSRANITCITDQLSQLNWIISSFNLTSAASLFFWAQITDLYGRHNALQSAIFVMVIGSAICTGSPTSKFSVLLLGRALQGVGAAGVNISIRTILADGVSLSEYALNWTIFALVSRLGIPIAVLRRTGYDGQVKQEAGQRVKLYARYVGTLSFLLSL